MSLPAFIAAAVAAIAVTPALAADLVVQIENAWLRPANPGQPATPLYADVTSSAPLRLVGATSEIAKSAALYSSELQGERPMTKQVSSFDVPGSGKLRLAPRGPFVELHDITRLVRTGDTVPFTLEFATMDGRTLRVEAQAVTRGILPRPTERPDGTSDAVTTPSTDGVPMPDKPED